MPRPADIGLSEFEALYHEAVELLHLTKELHLAVRGQNRIKNDGELRDLVRRFYRALSGCIARAVARPPTQTFTPEAAARKLIAITGQTGSAIISVFRDALTLKETLWPADQGDVVLMQNEKQAGQFVEQALHNLAGEAGNALQNSPVPDFDGHRNRMEAELCRAVEFYELPEEARAQALTNAGENGVETATAQDDIEKAIRQVVALRQPEQDEGRDVPTLADNAWYSAQDIAQTLHIDNAHLAAFRQFLKRWREHHKHLAGSGWKESETSRRGEGKYSYRGEVIQERASAFAEKHRSTA